EELDRQLVALLLHPVEEENGQRHLVGSVDLADIVPDEVGRPLEPRIFGRHAALDEREADERGVADAVALPAAGPRARAPDARRVLDRPQAADAVTGRLRVG